MNQFIAQGIKGRHSSADDFLAQIRQRTKDNRQDEITNFPELEDFLERRVVGGINDAERMSEAYDSLNRRIDESFSQVRTRLNFIQTSNITAFSRSTSNIVSELSITARSNLGIASEQKEHAVELNKMSRIQGKWSWVLLLIGIVNLAYVLNEFAKWLYPNTSNHKLLIFVIVVNFSILACFSPYIREKFEQFRTSKPVAAHSDQAGCRQPSEEPSSDLTP